MFLTHALRAIFRAAVVTGDSLWKFVTLLISGTPPAVTFISDASTNGNVLTLNGDTRPSNFNPYTPGYYSNYFDGTGDYLSVANNAVFAISGDYTLEFWVYHTTVITAEQDYILVDTTGSLGLGVNTTGVFIGRRSTAVDLQSTTTLTSNTWHHLAFSRSGTTSRIFVNGVQVASNTTTTYSYPQGAILIGGATGYFYTGHISNFRFVKGTAVYTAAFTPPTAPLTAISGTSLLTCQSNRLIDNSLNNFVITKNGDTTVSGFTPFTPPTSVTVNNLYSTYFDGTGDYLSIASAPAIQLNNTTAFTIEFWVNPFVIPAVGSAAFIFRGYNESSPYSGYGIGIGPNTTNNQLQWWDGTAWADIGIISANIWTHVAISYQGSGTTRRFFINGVLQGSAGTIPSTINYTSGTYTIGTRSADFFLTGYISNFRIVKGTAVYTANFTPPTAPLTAIANTSLLTCQDATIKDNSTNAFAITSNGQAQPVAQSPFTQTTTAVNTTYLGSGYFDGTGDYLTVPTNTAFDLGSDFTLEFWVYTGTSAVMGIVSTGDGTTARPYFYINGVVPTLLYNSTSIATGPNLTLNAWNHIAYTRSGTSIRVFTNGVAGTVATPALTSLLNSGLWIGSSSTVTQLFLGYISNFRISKGTALYTANFAPPATPLTAVANTSLLTLQTDQPAANKQFVDNSGNNFPITQVGNTTQGTFSPYGSNWSNYFDGTGDYLQTPASSMTTLIGTSSLTTASVFTIECWIYQTQRQTVVGTPTLLGDYTQAGVNYWSFGPNNSGLLTFFWYDGSARLATGNTTIPLNTWTHISVVINATNIKLFVNGTLQTLTGTTTLTNASSTTASLALGQLEGGGTLYGYYGYVSNLRIVKSALYTATFTPPTTPLTPITGTSLLTCQDNRFVDDSPNNFTLTRNGDVSVQRFSPFSPVIQTPTTYSTYFDGVWVNVNSGDYLTLNGQSNFAFGSNNFTVEMWVYATSFSANVVLYDSRPGNTSGVYGILYYDTAGIVNWNVNALTIAGTAITLNTWNHLAVSRSSTTTKLFINGTQVGTATDTNSYLNGALAPTIGSNGYSRGSNSMQGYLSNVRVVNGTAVYTANFTPSTTPLTAITNTVLLTCQSPTFIDNSINAFAITAVNEPKLSTYNPFGFTNTTTGTAFTPALYAGSAYFDGTGDSLTVPAGTAFAPGTGNFTVEGWYYSTAASGNQQMWAQTVGGSDYFVVMFTPATSQFRFIGNGVDAFSTAIAKANTWNHFAVVRVGTSVTVYCNGIAGTPVTFSNNFSNTTYVPTISGYTHVASNMMTGYLSNLRYVKGTAVYTGNFVPPLTPLTATAGTTLLLNMDKGAAVDSSRSNDLETVGDAKLRDETPYAGSYYSNFFDGTGDYLTTPTNASLALGTGDFTVECWVYFNSVTGFQSVFDFRTAQPQAAPVIYLANNSRFNYLWNGTTPNAFGPSLLSSNTWYHLALVRASGVHTAYVNGTSYSLSTTDSSGISSGTVVIGGSTVGGAGNFITGFISNVRVVKGTAVYTAAFTPSTTPLTAISGTSLLTCQSKSFVDNSSNNFTLTRTGDVAVKSQNPFQKNTYSSMFFDGTGDYLLTSSSAANPNFAFGTSDFTIEFWLYLNSTTGGALIVDFRPLTTNGFYPTIYIPAITTTSIAFLTNSADRIISAAGVIATGTWYHVALSRASGSTKLFVNGVQVGTTYADTNAYLGGANRPVLAAGGYDFTNPMNGYIADLRITKSARYTANFTPPTAPLPTS